MCFKSEQKRHFASIYGKTQTQNNNEKGNHGDANGSQGNTAK